MSSEIKKTCQVQILTFLTRMLQPIYFSLKFSYGDENSAHLQLGYQSSEYLRHTTGELIPTGAG